MRISDTGQQYPSATFKLDCGLASDSPPDASFCQVDVELANPALV
jgi:hypothetical protein